MEQINLNAEHLITLDKFVPRDYQMPVWDAIENKGYRKVLYVAPRRSGKDISAWNFAIRQCIKKTCLIYYCLQTYKHIRKVIFDAMTNDGSSWLSYIPKQLIASINKSEMQIRFINGSILQCVGVKNFDTSLIGTNAYGMVLSEFGTWPNADVFNYLRPIIAQNGGWILIVSCVAPDTMVINSKGLVRIKNISDSRKEYTHSNEMIFGLGGYHRAEQFYYGGTQKTLKITLQTGHTIECTAVHPLWDGKKWVKSADLSLGYTLPIQYGQDIWDNKYHEIHPEIFYILGATCAKGHPHLSQESQNHVENKYTEILVRYGVSINLILKELMKKFEIVLGATQRISDELLRISRLQMVSFIRGLFDAYGATFIPCKETNGAIFLYCKPKEFLQDIQIILTNLGYISYLENIEDKLTLVLRGHWAAKYYKEIGFDFTQKMDAYKDIGIKVQRGNMSLYSVDMNRLKNYKVPTSIIVKPMMTRFEIESLSRRRKHPYLNELLSEKFYYSPIVSIEESENEVFDFVIPETNSFFSNGFISHNTPRGENHMYHLHKLVEKLPDWFVLHQKTSEINHIPYEILMQEKAQMDPCTFAQEYECSYQRGQKGSYFGYAMDRLRENGQITFVPHEPQMLVYTAWDIGLNDPTTIVFWQQAQDASSIRVIDCYTSNQLGIDHYAQVISEKGKMYNYGTHFAPHDVMVREWGNQGQTRISSAHQLGLVFEKLPQQQIVESIQSALLTIPKMLFDEKKCLPLIEAIENYKREWSETYQMYGPKPAKSKFNHFADAFRYMCQAVPLARQYLSGKDYDELRRRSLGSSQDYRDRLSYFDPYSR